MSKPLKGFITYSHRDKKAKNKLLVCLEPMKREGLIDPWHDNEIIPGDKWREEIFSTNLPTSDIWLYLVSSDSLASETCNKELALVLEKNITPILIILEDCDWKNYKLSNIRDLSSEGLYLNEWESQKLSDFQALPAGVKPLNEWNPRSKGWQSVMEGIREVVHKIQSQTEAELAFKQGNFLLTLRQIDRAIGAYSRAIERDSHYIAAFSNRGNAYFKKGRFDLSIADYNAALKLNPNFSNAYYNRGTVYSKKGKHDLAIKDYTRAIGLDPKPVDAYNNRGVAYNSIYKVDKAIEDYNRALELNPNYAAVYYNRGNAYLKKGAGTKAIEDYTEAIRLNPKDTLAFNNRGNIYAGRGETDLAVKDYSKALELDPGLAFVYNNRGFAYDGRGEYEWAMEDYNKAIKLNPKLAQAYYNRAEICLHLRKWKKAKDDLISAKSNGLDIIASFRNDYKSVEAYEQQHRVKLPEDIALLLTQRRRTRYPKTRGVLDAEGKPLESPNVVNLRSQLRNAGTPLGEYVKTKPAFGINTAPTEAFVVDRATRDKLIAAHPSSTDILKPFLHGRDLRRWHVDTPHQWLIFAHRGIAINDYPAILKHLEKYRDPLRKRKGRHKWYELQASPDDAERFAQPKLVCPNLYNHQTFAVDTAGYYYGNTSYLIPTEETWLCGLLNSRTVEWFYSQVSNQLTIDYLRARSGYIQQIPVPSLTLEQKALIAKIVDYLIYLQQQPTINSKDLKHARDRVMLGYFERIIDSLVYEVYLPENLHKGNKHFFQPLFDEQLPPLEEIQGDKMSVFRDIFELLYERTHPIRRNLFFLDSVKQVRVIEDKL